MLWSPKSDVGIGPGPRAPSQDLKAKSPEAACSVSPVAGIRFESGCHSTSRPLDQAQKHRVFLRSAIGGQRII
jgi:hypothetical protein